MKVLEVNNQIYWVGEGNAASGVIPICPEKGTVCLAWRSAHVMSPNCWGTIGGAVQPGLTPAESAQRELGEEVGYHGEITLDSAYVFTDGGFSYYNFVGVVSTEFSFCPSVKHGWENSYIAWRPYSKVLDDMAKNPETYHPGVRKLFAESAEAIRKAIQSGKATEGTTTRKLFLDDVRQPPDSSWDVVHSFDEFVAHIDQNGVPDVISFDHDIVGEKTGLDCARYLIERGMLPRSWSVHSANPVGRINIIGELTAAEKRLGLANRELRSEDVIEAWYEGGQECLRQQAAADPNHWINEELSHSRVRGQLYRGVKFDPGSELLTAKPGDFYELGPSSFSRNLRTARCFMKFSVVGGKEIPVILFLQGRNNAPFPGIEVSRFIADDKAAEVICAGAFMVAGVVKQGMDVWCYDEMREARVEGFIAGLVALPQEQVAAARQQGARFFA